MTFILNDFLGELTIHFYVIIHTSSLHFISPNFLTRLYPNSVLLWAARVGCKETALFQLAQFSYLTILFSYIQSFAPSIHVWHITIIEGPRETTSALQLRVPVRIGTWLSSTNYRNLAVQFPQRTCARWRLLYKKLLTTTLHTHHQKRTQFQQCIQSRAARCTVLPSADLHTWVHGLV